MASVLTQKITYEEFLEKYADKRYEYVDGQPVPMGVEELDENGEWFVPPPKLKHGLITGRLTRMLSVFLNTNDVGELLMEMGFHMRPLPDVEHRAADIAFVTRERLASIPDIDEYMDFPPDLAVEVISPSDSAAYIRRKVRSYMANGTRLLWVVYPDDREIEVYEPGKNMVILTEEDTLTGGAVLPGFSVAVKEIFSVLDRGNE